MVGEMQANIDNIVLKDRILNKKEARAQKIIRILRQKNGATIKELSEFLSVSDMTVRRDLESLKDNEIIYNISGAYLLNDNSSFLQEEEINKYLLTEATTSNVKQKKHIGEYASALIEENDCVIIDNGSTTEYIANYLSPKIKATIVTCNLNIVNKLNINKNIDLIFGGGYFHPETSMFESTEGLSLFKKVRANKVFVSAAGVHLRLGATCVYNYEIETKKQIIQSAAERILVVDSSKFSKVSPNFFAGIDDFHRVITDDGIPEEWKKTFEMKKIDLDIV